MILLLNPGAERHRALDTFLEAQLAPGNPEYHRWLTSAAFAARFANSSSETAQVVAWLRSKGFAIAPLPAGRQWIEFSGTSDQVEHAFGTPVTAGATSPRISSEIKPPSAIAPLIQGLVSLDGTLSAPTATAPVNLASDMRALAAQTSPAQAEALTPALLARLLRLDSLRGQSPALTGTGQSIAIPTRSTVRPEDFAAFRQAFGLADAVELTVSRAASAEAEPTLARNDEESATLLAASWAAAVAPAARIVLVPANSTSATDGLDLALAAIVDGALAQTVSVGYSNCELVMSAPHRAFYAALYRQAAAQGISVVAATGDSGAAACHAAGDGAPVTTGFGVNGLASTPWNTAVGAAALASGVATGWGPASATDPAFATGGGASALYATPGWQSAPGFPSSDPGTAAGHHRSLPDLALPAALGRSSLAICYTADSSASACRPVSSGGSAAAAAIFAGISALLAEKYGPQGNLAPNLYRLNQTQLPDDKSAFVDITAGSARLTCEPGSPACSETGQIGFTAGPGYDLASGLGSVNAQALVENWATPQATGTLKDTVEMTTIGGVTYNPSANIVLSAKVISGSGGAVPTGTVQFFDDTSQQDTGSPVSLNNGTASYTEQGQFTIGGHNIQAKYSGDASYEPGTSQPVTINIQPSPTSLTVVPSTTTPAGGATITVTGTVKATNAGADPPTGALTINLDGLPQGTANLSTTASVTSASVQVTVPSAGSHTVQGTYSGDFNYNESTSASVAITVAKIGTKTSIAATPSTLTAGVPETFTATIAPAATTTSTTPATGTVSFYDGGLPPSGTLLGTATVSGGSAILAGITLSASATHTVIAVYSGDANYGASTSGPLVLEPVLLPVTVTLAASSSVLAPGQTASLTATVLPVSTPITGAEANPTGLVFFYSGAKLIGEATVTPGLGDTAIATLAVPSLAAGQYVITATYQGDLTYGAATSNSVTLQVEDFVIGSTTTNINMVQGTTAEVPFVVTSAGGLTGPIEIVCVQQNPPEVGAIVCTFSPSIVNGTGQATLTVVTKAGNIASNQQPPRPATPPWPAGGALALAILLLTPVSRRARILRKAATRRLLVFALLLAALATAGLGCSNKITPNGGGGTPLGVATLKISAAAYVNNVTVTHNAYLTVNVEP